MRMPCPSISYLPVSSIKNTRPPPPYPVVLDAMVDFSTVSAPAKAEVFLYRVFAAELQTLSLLGESVKAGVEFVEVGGLLVGPGEGG